MKRQNIRCISTVHISSCPDLGLLLWPFKSGLSKIPQTKKLPTLPKSNFVDRLGGIIAQLDSTKARCSASICWVVCLHFLYFWASKNLWTSRRQSQNPSCWTLCWILDPKIFPGWVMVLYVTSLVTDWTPPIFYVTHVLFWCSFLKFASKPRICVYVVLCSMCRLKTCRII